MAITVRLDACKYWPLRKPRQQTKKKKFKMTTTKICTTAGGFVDGLGLPAAKLAMLIDLSIFFGDYQVAMNQRNFDYFSLSSLTKVAFFEGLYVCVHEKLNAILSVMIGLFCSQIAKFANLARLTQTACLMLVSTLIRFADLSPREIEGLGFMPDAGGTWSVAIFFFLAAHIVATMAAT